MRAYLRNLSLALLTCALFGATVSADTLELRDGRLIQGKFVGGSELHIRFQVNGKEEVFDTKDVLSLSFDDNPGATPAANVSNNAAEAPPRTADNQQITVPAGTTILVRTIDGIDSATNKPGDLFQASLEDALVVGDTVVAPKGADVRGRLVEAKSSGHIQGKSELRLELTGISINGRMQPIVTGEYEAAGKSRGKQSAERIGGAAAVGAVIGAIAGGGKGAAIGAGVGAGAGTGVQVLTHGEQVKIPPETLLEFKLDQPLTVTPTS